MSKMRRDLCRAVQKAARRGGYQVCLLVFAPGTSSFEDDLPILGVFGEGLEENGPEMMKRLYRGLFDQAAEVKGSYLAGTFVVLAYTDSNDECDRQVIELVRRRLAPWEQTLISQVREDVEESEELEEESEARKEG